MFWPTSFAIVLWYWNRFDANVNSSRLKWNCNYLLGTFRFRKFRTRFCLIMTAKNWTGFWLIGTSGSISVAINWFHKFITVKWWTCWNENYGFHCYQNVLKINIKRLNASTAKIAEYFEFSGFNKMSYQRFISVFVHFMIFRQF